MVTASVSVPGDFVWDSWWMKWKWSGLANEFLQFCLPIIATPLLHIHLLPSSQMCGSPDQASYYHVFVLSLRTSSLTWYMKGHKVRKYNFNTRHPRWYAYTKYILLFLIVQSQPTHSLVITSKCVGCDCTIDKSKIYFVRKYKFNAIYTLKGLFML